MTSDEEGKKDNNDKLMVKTPWGKLITSKGIDKLFQGLLKDVEQQNRKIAKLETALKKAKELEDDVLLTKDNSIKTKRAISQLLEKFDADQDKQKRMDEFLEKMDTITETFERLDEEFAEFKEHQEKHAKRIDAIFDTIVTLMEKMEKLGDLEAKRRSSVKNLAERLDKLESKVGVTPRKLSDKLKTVSATLEENPERDETEDSPELDSDIKTAILRELAKEQDTDDSD